MGDGVSDWADPTKRDGWQKYAAEAAAAYVVALLRSIPFEQKSRPQAIPGDAESIYSGAAKYAVCSRLVDDWQDLADVCDIPPHDRAKFEHGRGTAGVWEWLAARGKLAFLPTFLGMINRTDLVEEPNRRP